jgi:hypothetical protein
MRLVTFESGFGFTEFIARKKDQALKRGDTSTANCRNAGLVRTKDL